MSLLIVGLDTTIVNVALPSIHRDLNASVSGLQWTIDAYTLVLASLLMLAGSTADRVGRRRVFQLGLVVFSIGSLLCGVAPTLGVLIAARVVQAVGGSMLNPVAMSIIRNVFEDPRERARAIGLWGAVFGLSLALGPVVGGALVDAFSWRAVFFVNIPIGLTAIVLTALYVPESRAARPRRLDPIGQLLVIVGLASLTFAIIEGPHAGWTSAQTLGVFALAASCLIALVPYELHRREPLLEIRFFRSAPFSGRERDRGRRVRGDRRLPVPEHAVPTARPRASPAPRGPVHAADGGDDPRVRADLRSDRRQPGLAAAAGGGRGRPDRGGR